MVIATFGRTPDGAQYIQIPLSQNLKVWLETKPNGWCKIEAVFTTGESKESDGET